MWLDWKLKLPNSIVSVEATDFITAFGRLLLDGNLRDMFAVNPQAAAEKVQLRPVDCPTWLRLVPEDVEFQANILLRKRLDLVKFFTPETCRQLGEKLWVAFRDYARVNWPPDGSAKISDSFHFCHHLKKQIPEVVVAAEWNRLDFAFSKQKTALHWIHTSAPNGSARRGLQFFFRGKDKRWLEFFFHLGL